MELLKRSTQFLTASAIIVASQTALSAPKKKTPPPPPEPNCSTVYVVDNKTGAVLENKNGDTPFGLASVTKLFTVAGAQIALDQDQDKEFKVEDNRFKDVKIDFQAPKKFSASQIFHFESCEAPVFRGKKIPVVTLSPQDSIRALLTVSANPVSHPLKNRLISFFNIDSFPDLIKKVLSIAKIPENQVVISKSLSDDPSGMSSAKKCNPEAKTPEERDDHKATAPAIATLFNYITNHLSAEDIDPLLKAKQKFGHLWGGNTNPFLGYRGLTITGKTGTVTGIGAGVFRVTDPKNPNTDLTIVLSCPASIDRKIMGRRLIDHYAFARTLTLMPTPTPTLERLDILPIKGNSPEEQTETAILTNGTQAPPARDF